MLQKFLLELTTMYAFKNWIMVLEGFQRLFHTLSEGRKQFIATENETLTG